MEQFNKTKTCAQLASPDVFEKLFDDYSEKLYAYAYFHLNSKEEAKDVLSETFVKFWKYIMDNPDLIINSVPSFLYKITRNLIIDYRRRGRIKFDSLDNLFEQGFEFPADLLLSEEDKAEFGIILKAMDQLKPQDKDILLLRFIEDMPNAEIARIYGITESNVSVRLFRALRSLRAVINPLKDTEGDSPAAETT